MRKSLNILSVIIFMIVSFIISCESNTKSKIEPELKGHLDTFSECKILNKSTGLSKIVSILPDTMAAIEYHYNGENVLTLTHINAGFNCCPDSIYTEVSIEENDIVIEECEKESGCHCNCLYDLVIVIENIQPGNYSFTFIEPYLNEDNDIITFILGINDEKEGVIKFNRDGYPWGIKQI